jgi:hypothetical protein
MWLLATPKCVSLLWSFKVLWTPGSINIWSLWDRRPLWQQERPQQSYTLIKEIGFGNLGVKLGAGAHLMAVELEVETPPGQAQLARSP